METVGLREFRDNLATYVVQGKSPVAVTRHGDTVGYFIPARQRPTPEMIQRFRDKMAAWQKELDAAGIDEAAVEEMVADFERLRKIERG